MPNLVPVQESFAAGELSPHMYSRTSTKGYKEGVRILENMMPLPQGPGKRRPGFSFAFEAPDTSPTARLIVFQVSIDDYYLFLFTDLKLYVLNKTGQPVALELVQNSQFHASAANWTSNPGAGASIVFTTVSCILTSSLARTAWIRQEVTGLVIGNTYQVRVIQIFPFDALRIRVGDVAGGAERAEVNSGLGVTLFTFVATAVSHWIEVASLAAGVAAVIESVSVQVATPAVAQPSPFGSDVLGLLQSEQTPDGTKMYITSGLFPVKEVVHLGAGVFTIADAVFISPPANWAGTNHPRALTFFQGRFWLAGTGSMPSTFWGSKSGVFLNFTLGTAADDAIANTIAKRGDIKWIAGAKNLLIGTENTEYVVSAPSGAQDIITPTSVAVEPQSNYGSTSIQPSLLGNAVLFFSGDGRKLHSMSYRFEESGWVSADLAFAADHITLGGVVRQAFTQNPQSILWAIDSQGRLLGCSYERPNNIIGWHRHPVNNMVFNSIASAKFFGADFLWASWRIVRGGTTFIQIGVLSFNLSLFLDSAKPALSLTPIVLFPGYQHLAGLTVGVIADGAVHPPVVVSGAGEVSLQFPASVIFAGLQSNARLLSLPFEPGVASQGTEPFFKRFNRAFVKVLSSSKPLINGIRPNDRTPQTPMDLPEPFTSASYFSVGLGYALEASIDVQEPLPIPLTVGGIYGEMVAEKT